MSHLPPLHPADEELLNRVERELAGLYDHNQLAADVRNRVYRLLYDVRWRLKHPHGVPEQRKNMV